MTAVSEAQQYPQFAALASGAQQPDNNEDLPPFIAAHDVGWELNTRTTP